MELENNSHFFCNSNCKYFPCHKGVPEKEFNCLFCYCPLYALGEKCGGNFKFRENGIKDCTGCTIPHCADNYEHIIKLCRSVVEQVRKKGI